MRRTGMWLSIAVLGAIGSVPSPAAAFCGFYAGSATSELTASASQVVLLRDGTRTVLTMQNRYEGPPEDFALVVPVPEVIREGQVRALDPAIFERVDTLTAPRVVEYTEAAPICPSSRRARVSRVRLIGYTSTVSVEAEFSTAEYDIVVLSATDSTELESWLRGHHYHVPDGAAAALRPYIDAGSKFFVARVDASRVRFVEGRAVLSPLRVHFEAPTLSLPVRLGTLNSRGTQDLVVHVLAREQRYEVANRQNLLAPTNVEVAPAAIGRIGELYESLFDSMMDESPDAVVTEYAWTGAGCDPCAAGALRVEDLNALGGDVASGGVVEAVGPPRVDVISLRRLSGRASNERGLRRRIERQLEHVETCVAGMSSARGQVVHELDVIVRRDGRLGVPRSATRGEGSRACIARRLRGIRVDAPPLGVERSRWRVELSPARRLMSRQSSTYGFTLTRLRTRTRKTGRIDDLVFRPARSITGGREAPDALGVLAQQATDDARDSFQSRFVVLNRNPALAQCDAPVHGGWSAGRPGSSAERPTDGAASREVRALIRTPVERVTIARRESRHARLRKRAKPRASRLARPR